MNKQNQKVRLCLQENNMYQWQLAEIMGVSPQKVSEWLRIERPDEIQNALCDIINGNHENIEKTRQYFKKKSMADSGLVRDKYVNMIYWEVKELESDIEKQKERDEWLYEYTKGGKR